MSSVRKGGGEDWHMHRHADRTPPNKQKTNCSCTNPHDDHETPNHARETKTPHTMTLENRRVAKQQTSFAHNIIACSVTLYTSCPEHEGEKDGMGLHASCTMHKQSNSQETDVLPDMDMYLAKTAAHEVVRCGVVRCGAARSCAVRCMERVGSFLCCFVSSSEVMVIRDAVHIASLSPSCCIPFAELSLLPWEPAASCWLMFDHGTRLPAQLPDSCGNTSQTLDCCVAGLATEKRSNLG